jgi:hypothetical protein
LTVQAVPIGATGVSQAKTQNTAAVTAKAIGILDMASQDTPSPRLSAIGGD